MTLAVVGGIHPDADGSNRLFEIALCAPGDRIELRLEPGNRHDPSAVAVISACGTQLGYLSAERCGWIGSRIRLGEDVRARFQEPVKGGALIRVSFSGAAPVLPTPKPKVEDQARCEPDDFYPDYIPPDERGLPSALSSVSVTQRES